MSILPLKRRIPVLVLIAICLLGVVSHAQSKKTLKEAQKLSDLREQATTDFDAALDQLKSLLTQYNAILDGSAATRKADYKALDKDAKSMDKLIENSSKTADSVLQQAEGVWALWQADNDALAAGIEKDKSQERLETRKKRYGDIDRDLAASRESLKSFVANLRDQIDYLGKDLSEDAILDLKPEAAKLNEEADALGVAMAAVGTDSTTEAEAEPTPTTDDPAADDAAADDAAADDAAADDAAADDAGADDAGADDAGADDAGADDPAADDPAADDTGADDSDSTGGGSGD